MPRSSVTIQDVAAHAGVSVATASRALSGVRRVSPDLVARVERASRELGYRRNAVARALRRRKTGIVGMVVPEISNPFFPAIVEAVERHLQASDRDLVLCDSRNDPDLEAHRLRALLERQVDGLIISPCDERRSAAMVAEAAARIPLVQLDRQVDGELTDWVGVDDAAGIGALVQHLCGLGLSDTAYVGAEVTNSSARLRLAAYQSAPTLRPAASRRVYLGAFTTEWGEQATRQILAERRRRPAAIVCGNDAVAFGVLRRLREAGVHVPGQVAVTGFDDVGFTTLCDPTLTTVRQPFEQMAAECIRLLDQRAGDPANDGYAHIAIAPRLIVRASTPATADGARA